MGSRQDQKHEKLLRELLKLPDNKRCPNCDSIGPQYVVSQFHVFVCTVCSGVHRQFGHRVKGVSMSTFKPEEIKALQEGGNGPFVARYLAKWTQAQLPKPTDRNADRIREWIQAVYETKRFLDAEKQYTPQSPRPASKSTSDGKEVVVRQLSDVLGAGTPKLVVSRTDSVDRSPAKSASSAAAQSAGQPAVSLLDVSSPKAPAGAGGAAAAAAAPAWDAFGGSPAAPVVAAAAAAPTGTDGWAAFGDGSPAPAAAAPPAASAAPTPAAASTAQDVNSGWEAFGEQPAAAAVSAVSSAAASPSPVKPEAPQQQGPPQPKKEERREVPLDAFFPEFEQIRATGLLPNGQPAPMPLRAPPQFPGYSRTSSQQAYAPVQQPYGGAAAYGGYMQQPAAVPGAYGAAPRPTVVIPAAPAYPSGMVPSPGVAPSPSAYAPAYSPQGIISPTGSMPAPYTNGSGYARTDSHGSTPTEVAPAQQPQHGAADPFASLAPGLKGALPSYPSSNGRAAAAAPAPPAVQPQFGAGFPAAAPAAAYPAAPSPAAVGPAGAGSPFGSSSLYSGPPSLSHMPYDLSAPAAPKPKASGNPFA